MDPIIAKQNLQLVSQGSSNVKDYKVAKDGVHLEKVSRGWDRLVRWIKNLFDSEDERVKEIFIESLNFKIISAQISKKSFSIDNAMRKVGNIDDTFAKIFRPNTSRTEEAIQLDLNRLDEILGKLKIKRYDTDEKSYDELHDFLLQHSNDYSINEIVTAAINRMDEKGVKFHFDPDSNKILEDKFINDFARRVGNKNLLLKNQPYNKS